MQDSGFVQRAQIRSFYEISKPADHDFAEIVFIAKMEPEASARLIDAASLESAEIDAAKLMEQLGWYLPRFNR